MKGDMRRKKESVPRFRIYINRGHIYPSIPFHLFYISKKKKTYTPPYRSVIFFSNSAVCLEAGTCRKYPGGLLLAPCRHRYVYYKDLFLRKKNYGRSVYGTSSKSSSERPNQRVMAVPETPLRTYLSILGNKLL